MFFVGIDPSLKSTGLVVLKDDEPKPVFAADIKADKGKDGLLRVIDLRDGVMGNIAEHVNGCPVLIAIEGYALHAMQNHRDLLEIGTALRLAIIQRKQRYVEPMPSQVQSFVGFKKPPKRKKGQPRRSSEQVRLDALASKPHKEVLALWGFEHPSGDVIDAYVMAQIARAMSRKSTLKLTPAMQDVVLSTHHGASLGVAVGS